ncbi:DNA-binding response regulator [Lactonifactor longoviformis]|uniref:Stage 0 sporulation protein A homolog n=1 Tax=Lactonifactor longoviformis DSM 17459 TaxID=1122155 RepID=A0A1M4SSK7_9CLOT|nr:response regulator transcription factor [Lactonifactor longoviformis]POP32974.1 DNA-binding response regulator [Lactonifactor longoviformis]SHE35243.1 DNA-binding response regulator, OmpR family, contains REC and winged-helix (wHTH) domain [Lactonifactor longoviformis DSM 17459]
MSRIMIVEDDQVIARAIKKHLESWDFEVHCAEDFQKILSDFAEFQPELVLLDISLPFYNGFYWCTEIRKLSKVPIIFLSSTTDNMSIIMAMNMGGDDFIEKPFDLHVLTAKIQALFRRAYSFQGKVDMIEHKGVILNLGDAALYYQGDKVELTKNEFRILQTLMEQAQKAVSRSDIMTKLWESDSYIDDNTLTVNVTRLRKKLEDAGLTDFIKTKKGIGYMVE